MIRIAAVGDVHVGEDARGILPHELERLSQAADVFLLAGDLTQHGSSAEAGLLADTLALATVPVVCVLGNHDYHQGQQDVIRRQLEAVGVHVLEGEAVCLEVRQKRLGIGGVKGFGNGFIGACASEFGEPEMKSFVRHARDRAEALERALEGLVCDVKVALTHYAPVSDTLRGERPEIFPFLGSYFLGRALDAGGVQLGLHGHAHGGTERGVTPGGVPVRNVARQVIERAYKVYCLGSPDCDLDEPSPASVQ